MMNPQRARQLKGGRAVNGPVVYWMSRDQRLRDNWALFFARQAARERKAPVAILFCLVPTFLNASRRSYAFMLRGLEELAGHCDEQGIPFHLVMGDPVDKVPEFVASCGAGVLVTDFDPLRIKRQWQQTIMRKLLIPFYEVDTHNLLPCWQVSPKQEFSARTLRVKYARMLEDSRDDFPPGGRRLFPSGIADRGKTDWTAAAKFVQADPAGLPRQDVKSGEDAAHAVLRGFLKEGLSLYHQVRNDPTEDGQSGLSPYLHFGQLSAQRVALEVRKVFAPAEAKAAFLEELTVRRELADNFCFYNPDYDRFKGFPAWAQATLNAHRRDVRIYQYSLSQFERAQTHDALWNAAQMEMVRTGKMHGFMRMYWAKKILEWSASPEMAMQIAVTLNDRYELDGRDPNGYAGCAWSVGGVHDRPWRERPIFGMIRYMNEQGCRRKFDVDAYIERVDGLAVP